MEKRTNQKSMMFTMSGIEEITAIMAVIKQSGQTPANFLRQACGLQVRQKGKRYDIADADKNMNTLYAKARTWVDKDGVFQYTHERKKETGLTKLGISVALTKLVEKGLLEVVGEATDMKFKIVAKNKKGGAK